MYTTVEFGHKDICAYVLTSESMIQYDIQIELVSKGLQDANIFVLSGQSLTNLTNLNSIVQDQTLVLAITDYHVIVALPTNNSAAPIVSFTYQNVKQMTTREFAIKNAQFLVITFLALCLFGICAGNFAVNSELDELKVPPQAEYNKHLQEYVKVGNVWDPEEEEAVKEQHQALADEGGHPEEEEKEEEEEEYYDEEAEEEGEEEIEESNETVPNTMSDESLDEPELVSKKPSEKKPTLVEKVVSEKISQKISEKKSSEKPPPAPAQKQSTKVSSFKSERLSTPSRQLRRKGPSKLPTMIEEEEEKEPPKVERPLTEAEKKKKAEEEEIERHRRRTEQQNRNPLAYYHGASHVAVKPLM